MKHVFALFLLTGLITVGCYRVGSETTIGSDDPSIEFPAIDEPISSKYVRVVETLATSTDADAVRLAAELLEKGGLDSIRALRNHLNDHRIPPLFYVPRAVSGEPDMADYCFWLIQGMIEGAVPKLYEGLYSSLSRDVIEQWLDERANKSMLELQLDAAHDSLSRALDDYESGGEPYARQAIEFYQERLRQLKKETK